MILINFAMTSYLKRLNWSCLEKEKNKLAFILVQSKVEQSIIDRNALAFNKWYALNECRWNAEKMWESIESISKMICTSFCNTIVHSNLIEGSLKCRKICNDFESFAKNAINIFWWWLMIYAMWSKYDAACSNHRSSQIDIFRSWVSWACWIACVLRVKQNAFELIGQVLAVQSSSRKKSLT